MQRIDIGMRAANTDGTPRVVLGRPQHIADRLRSDGYEDERPHRGSVNQNTSISTQQTEFELRVVKTYNNTESHAGHEENSWEATDCDAKGCNQEGTSARSGQTSV